MTVYSWSRPPLKHTSAAIETVREIFGLSEERFTGVPVLDEVELPASGLTYVRGYSGSGKSRLLRMFLADHPEAQVPHPPTGDAPLVELLDLPLPEALSLLGQVGLGEAFVCLTPYEALSDGQKARAQLALAYARGGTLLVVDEFLSNLDRVSAKAVAYSFQRFCRKRGVSAVVATAHDDLVEALGPDLLITLDYNGSKSVVRRPCEATAPFRDEVVVREGTADDYAELARFHYMGGLDVSPEAYRVQLRALELRGRVVGVQVMSSPYPRSWERHAAYADVNETLTLVQRVIVHPVFRGIGLAGLLCDPVHSPTPWVFLRSALGRFQPFPLSVGYEAVEVASCARTELASRVARVREDGLDEGTDFVRERSIELLMLEYLQYRQIAGLRELDAPVLNRVRGWFARCVDTLTDEQAWASVHPFPMAGFVARRPDQRTA
ncbi:hypothetical protein AB0A69_15235 [Streptomyces sp. NPDC045431]|uniref:hypothetical protein n=1 Tax=Streptomyces sp. NPDC045431 TaxID=3155613 RepID=UPI0033CB39E1